MRFLVDLLVILGMGIFTLLLLAISVIDIELHRIGEQRTRSKALRPGRTGNPPTRNARGRP